MILIETLRGREKETIKIIGAERPVNFFFARFVNDPVNHAAFTDFETYVRVDALPDHLKTAVVEEVKRMKP